MLFDQITSSFLHCLGGKHLLFLSFCSLLGCLQSLEALPRFLDSSVSSSRDRLSLRQFCHDRCLCLLWPNTPRQHISCKMSSSGNKHKFSCGKHSMLGSDTPKFCISQTVLSIGRGSSPFCILLDRGTLSNYLLRISRLFLKSYTQNRAHILRNYHRKSQGSEF